MKIFSIILSIGIRKKLHRVRISHFEILLSKTVFVCCLNSNKYLIRLKGLLGTLFIRANVWWARFRKNSRLGQYPVMEVLGITLLNGIIAFPNPYTRMSSTNLIYLLFSQCGVANTDDLWYN